MLISGEKLIDSIAKSLRRINGDELDDRSLAKILGMNPQTALVHPRACVTWRCTNRAIL